ncbi:3'-5' exonuclease [Fluviispira vulneris]|uniref:3'-5' exonuclease n=1 Tax=Fluviispira vulneris TaxID=2763012 RepID=UPI001647C473|nr:3'-5' exonuclease [Fluviispira vulneris]
MSSPFHNSLFHFLLSRKENLNSSHVAIMGGVSGSRFAFEEKLSDLPIVIFDFETTGLDIRTAKIIEIGAIKYLGRKEVGRFSELIDPKENVSEEITRITGIDNSMLVGKPSIQEILPKFHDFLRGCVGFAHNAEFDVGMLHHESYRLGISCDYTIFCSLKMARALVKIERRNLDALAAHYGLTFESRHRSIGDILVTAGVLWRMIDENPELQTIADFSSYREEMLG